MSFEYASVTKGLMLGIAITSITAGLFDVKYYLHLQLVPHISKYHQYWRLFTWQIACANSSDLFLIELSLYNVGMHIERAFGSLKFASFILVTFLMSIISTFLSLLFLQAFPHVGALFNSIPCGPFALIFSVMYQYMRVVPPAYHFKVFGLDLTDKIWAYAIAGQSAARLEACYCLLHLITLDLCTDLNLQLAISKSPATLLPAVTGLLCGYLYRSDFLQLKSWRVPHRAVVFAQSWHQSLLGEGRAIRRTNRVLPEGRSTRRRDSTIPTLDEDEVVTTSRRRGPRTATATGDTVSQNLSATPQSNTPQEEQGTGGVMRQLMSELRGGARPNASGEGTVRAPSESEIQLLTAMFPDVGREVILGVLQRRQVPCFLCHLVPSASKGMGSFWPACMGIRDVSSCLRSNLRHDTAISQSL
ncbi:hypothetical protein OBBRIDRAFT_769970 [Obba rivulosa]|uniref:Peptidase S54 rhomboid domain-containing protein n=1 Tax=Obba rivulosa TaxID=1052685 RepID=A0A8E2DR65_9APHY|nr:hypothetical protein OBBRIDRAFT_769970 [Obba rivulosa]